MKKIVYLSAVFIIALLVFNIILLKKNNELKQQNLSIMDKYNELSVKELRVTSILKKNSIFQHAAEALYCPDIQLKDPKTKNDIKLSALVKDNEPLLFFRFKENDCDACIQQAIRMLKKISENYPNQRITILSGYKNARQFYAYADSETKTFDIYNVDDFPVIPEQQENPYFFVLNGGMEMKNVFVPVKEDMELTADYLGCITQKYWSCGHEHCDHDHSHNPHHDHNHAH